MAALYPADEGLLVLREAFCVGLYLRGVWFMCVWLNCLLEFFNTRREKLVSSKRSFLALQPEPLHDGSSD